MLRSLLARFSSSSRQVANDHPKCPNVLFAVLVVHAMPRSGATLRKQQKTPAAAAVHDGGNQDNDRLLRRSHELIDRYRRELM
jgi:hypothetical protein